MKVLVFTTAFNEEKTIGGVLDRVLDVAAEMDHQVDVLVVDDGSEDDTATVAAGREVILVELPRNLGPGAATRTGYKYAVRHGYDITVRMDADGQHRPEDIPKILEPVVDGEADIVIASRYKKSTDYETTAVRNIGIRFYSWLISQITGVRVYDITSGFRAVRIGMGQEHAESLPRGIIAINRGIREGLSGYRVMEVGVEMERREHGQSYLSFGRMVRYPLYAMYSFVVTLLGMGRR